MASTDAKTYATALRGAGGDARKTWESLREVNHALSSVPRLKQLLVGIGTRPQNAQAKEIKQLFKGQPAPVQRLLGVLATETAVDIVPDILEAYTILLKEDGFVPVTIETAQKLSSASLSGLLKSAKVDRRKALLEVIEEPSLIGGVRVQVGDTIHDFSIGGALDQVATNVEVRV